jgi:hypothetical protein
MKIHFVKIQQTKARKKYDFPQKTKNIGNSIQNDRKEKLKFNDTKRRENLRN